MELKPPVGLVDEISMLQLKLAEAERDRQLWTHEAQRWQQVAANRLMENDDWTTDWTAVEEFDRSYRTHSDDSPSVSADSSKPNEILDR
jgi:hypothetical protein